MKSSRPLWAILTALGLAAPAGALHESPTLPSPSKDERAPAAVILDPGHGGDDFGAVVGGRQEKDIALAIARRVKEHLEQMGGAPVKLTRDSDIFIPLNLRVDDNLGSAGQAFISLHLNQVRSKKRHGITVYAFGKDRFKTRRRKHRQVPPLPAPPENATRASAALAVSIVRSLRAQGFRVDPPAKAGFYVLKNPRLPSVLIELGYLSNPQEAARLDNPEYQNRLAEALAVSLQSYFVAASPSGR